MFTFINPQQSDSIRKITIDGSIITLYGKCNDAFASAFVNSQGECCTFLEKYDSSDKNYIRMKFSTPVNTEDVRLFIAHLWKIDHDSSYLNECMIQRQTLNLFSDAILLPSNELDCCITSTAFLPKPQGVVFSNKASTALLTQFIYHRVPQKEGRNPLTWIRDAIRSNYSSRSSTELEPAENERIDQRRTQKLS